MPDSLKILESQKDLINNVHSTLTAKEVLEHSQQIIKVMLECEVPRDRIRMAILPFYGDWSKIPQETRILHMIDSVCLGLPGNEGELVVSVKRVENYIAELEANPEILIHAMSVHQKFCERFGIEEAFPIESFVFLQKGKNTGFGSTRGYSPFDITINQDAWEVNIDPFNRADTIVHELVHRYRGLNGCVKMKKGFVSCLHAEDGIASVIARSMCEKMGLHYDPVAGEAYQFERELITEALKKLPIEELLRLDMHKLEQYVDYSAELLESVIVQYLPKK